MEHLQEPCPYPPSRAVTKLVWDSEIVRLGGERAGDNWPMTWGDDDLLYSALGDGYGFGPRSADYTLAFATISGNPPDHTAHDVPSNIDTLVGWGKDGIKASGMLMVDGLLHLFVRNYVVGDDWRHSRLARSEDHGRTWAWADWHFSEAFGCPEFVQFGPDYACARDTYVYIVSQDGNSAYDLDPDIAMARMRKDQIGNREAYEFYAGSGADGGATPIRTGTTPMWTGDITHRRPIFSDPKGTQRIAITYNRPLRRYFLVTAHAVPSGIPHTPALGVFDAPEPWGPWTTVYYRDDWAHDWMIHHKFPTKWMSDDGKTMWLVFSGEWKEGGTDYCLLTRRARLSLGHD